MSKTYLLQQGSVWAFKAGPHLRPHAQGCLPNLHSSHTRTTLLLCLGRNYQQLSVPQHCDQQPGTRHDCTREYVLPKVKQELSFQMAQHPN